jgi:hypothetical protein
MTTSAFFSALGGSIGSSLGGSLFGGKKGKSPTNADFRDALRRLAWQDRNWQLHTIGYQAPKYGIHPNVAAGISPYNSGASTGYYGTRGSSFGSDVGSAIGSAAGQAIFGRKERQQQAARAQQLHDAQLDEIQSRARLYKSEAYLANSKANQNFIAQSALASQANRDAQNKNINQDPDVARVANGVPVHKTTPVPSKPKKFLTPGGNVWITGPGTSQETVEQEYGQMADVWGMYKYAHDYYLYNNPNRSKHWSKLANKHFRNARNKIRARQPRDRKHYRRDRVLYPPGMFKNYR